MKLEQIGEGMKSTVNLVGDVMERGQRGLFSLKPFQRQLSECGSFAEKLNRVKDSEGAKLISANIRTILRNLRIHSKSPIGEIGDKCRDEILRNLEEMDQNILKL